MNTNFDEFKYTKKIGNTINTEEIARIDNNNNNVSTSTTLSLEQAIVEIIKNSKHNLTNTEIRTQLHQKKISCVKRDINKTLHELKNRNVLQVQTINNYNHWKLSTSEISTSSEICVMQVNNHNSSSSNSSMDVSVKMDDGSYSLLLSQVKQKALKWKNSGSTNILPTRFDRIVKFIENSVLNEISPEVLREIAQDIVKNGWE